MSMGMRMFVLLDLLIVTMPSIVGALYFFINVSPVLIGLKKVK